MARAAPPHCTHHKTPLFPFSPKFSPFSSPLPILGPRRDGQLLAVYILCINGCPRGVFCHEPNSRGPQWVSPGNRSGACALSAPTNQSLCTLPCLRVDRHSSFKALFMTTVFAQIQSMINKDPLFNVRVRFTVSINCCAPFFYCSFHPLNYPFFYKPVKCSQNGMHQKRI